MICLKEKTFNQLLNLAINNCNKNNKNNKINKPIYRPINLIRTNLTNSNFPTLTPENWNQNNTELHNNLNKFFTQFFAPPKREEIKPETYNNIQQAVIKQYKYIDYQKNIFDFASQDYLGSSNVKINTDIIPTDDNIKLALFILQNLDNYQLLNKNYFQTIFNPYIYFIYQDKTIDATGYIYDYLKNIKFSPTIFIFLTALRINLNLIIHSNQVKYKGYDTIEDMSPLFTEFGDNIWNPATDYCNNKLNL
jgi:hypothetical protein